MEDADSTRFIKDIENRIGAKIIYRTFCNWYGRIGGEIREWGVFLYSEGSTIYFEDYERVPSILGFKIPHRNKEEYVKMEISFPISEIASVYRVTRSSAEKSLKSGSDFSKESSVLDLALRKIVTKITLNNGEIMFFEMMSHKEFVTFLRGAR